MINYISKLFGNNTQEISTVSPITTNTVQVIPIIIEAKEKQLILFSKLRELIKERISIIKKLNHCEDSEELVKIKQKSDELDLIFNNWLSDSGFTKFKFRTNSYWPNRKEQSRYLHIAYSLFKGKEYSKIENPREENSLETWQWEIINAIKDSFPVLPKKKWEGSNE